MKQTTTKNTESTYLRGIRAKRDEVQVRLRKAVADLPTAQAEAVAAKEARDSFDREHENYQGTGIHDQRYGLTVARDHTQRRVSDLESAIRGDEVELRQLTRTLEASVDCARLAAGLRENRERRQTVAEHRDRAVAVRDGEAGEAQAKSERRDALRKAHATALVEARMRGERTAPSKELIELDAAIVEHESARDAASETVTADDVEIKMLDDASNEMSSKLRGAQCDRAEIAFRDAVEAVAPAIAEYEATIRRGGGYRKVELPTIDSALVQAALVRLQAEEQPLRAAVAVADETNASDEPAAA